MVKYADVVAHLVGITSDLNAGQFGSGDADTWTAAQVHTRRERWIDELATEWDEEASKFEQGLRLLGYEIGSHYVGDLLQHTSDIRHAVGEPSIDDDQALVIGLDFYLDSFHEALTAADVGSVAIQVPDETWVLGSGPLIASLAANRFSSFDVSAADAAKGRFRALAWSGTVEDVLTVISLYTLPPSDIMEI